MTLVQGIVLGAVQGIAEFLPISSSGHLKVAQALFNLDDVPLLFSVILHLATLLVVVIFFRKKIWELLKAFARLIFRRPAPTKCKNKNGNVVELSTETALAEEKNRRRYILAVIITTAVTGVIGLFIEKLIGDIPVKYIFFGFIVTAMLLVASSFFEKKAKVLYRLDENSNKAPTWLQALAIGLAQGIGTLPGVSRSGSTISGSLFSKVTRKIAGEYSFIASIPAILGAFILEAKDLGEMTSAVGIAPLVAGCVTAFVTGYIALFLLMKIIKKGRLEWFACYLIPAAIFGLIYFR